MITEDPTAAYEDYGTPLVERDRRISVLERESRELRGELMALRHGIQKIEDECKSILQTA